MYVGHGYENLGTQDETKPEQYLGLRRQYFRTLKLGERKGGKDGRREEDEPCRPGGRKEYNGEAVLFGA